VKSLTLGVIDLDLGAGNSSEGVDPLSSRSVASVTLGLEILLWLGSFAVSSFMGLRSLSVEEDRDEEDCDEEDLLLVLSSSSNLIENLR
jgi:hypothetical protein